jgi:Ca-activated chloride channel homolog
MMPMPPRNCLRCGAHLAPHAQFCPACGTAVGPAPTLQENWACLRTTSGEPVPLLGVALGGEVFGAHARLVLRQRYRNQESSPIEAVYTFPIPSDATLVGFAMECEGRRIEAEVKEREEAFQTYDDAISKGHGAALLEQERPNVFTASVGNLLPDEETVVEVTFLQKLTADEGALRLMIPTLVAPRYIPGSPAGDRTGHGASPPTTAVPDADRITPKIGAVRYGLAMDLVFDLGRDVTIESPSHRIETIDEGAMRRRVTFTSPTVALDRDIVLIADGAPGVTAGVVCDKPAGEEGTFALTIVPDLFEAKRRSKGRAVVFLVDVSGSMGGESITQAKLAMRLCLRHLSEGDQFDILPFSTGFSHFSDAVGSARHGGEKHLVPFTQSTLKAADDFVGALQANGGTEILSPLLAASKLLSGVKRDRIIVLLTDGQVGNEAQILTEMGKEPPGTRVYTFGIGTNVSDWLLRELARRTKGAVELIHPGERIDEKVTAQFAKATAARVDGLSLKWVGADAGEVAPSEPPALVDGEPWSVYGRYEAPGIGRVEIRGTLGGEPFFMEVPMELPASADRPALTSLWAGARVRDLEEVDVSTLGRRAETHKKRIVDLCVRHRIASKHASFVVVEKRTGDRRSQGMPETRAVPVNAPAGWAMFQRERESATRTRAGTVSQAQMSQLARMQVIGGAPAPRSAAPVPRSPARPMAPPPPPMMQGSPEKSRREAPPPLAAPPR